MQRFATFATFAAGLAALTLLTACQEQGVEAGATATRTALDSFHSGVCDVFPTLDRSPLPSPPRASSRTPVNQVVAGFQSVFAPGAPPVACDRLHVGKVQGLTAFQASLDARLAPATTNAFLEISAFTPEDPVSVTETEPWGGGLQSFSNTTRERCRFRVKAVSTGFGSGTDAAGWLASTPLSTGTGQFWVPLARTERVNVTPEFRRGLSGSGFLLQLAIEPDDPFLHAKASNRCAGQFTVRLRLMGPD